MNFLIGLKVNSFERLITPIIEDNGCSFYDSEVVTEGSDKYFRVYITSTDGVSIDSCAKISRLISPILDVEEPVSGKYFFEVSSPGLERKLTKIDNFTKSIGENIKIKLENGDKVFGTIIAVNSDIIDIKTQNGIEKIKYVDIKTARTIFKW